MNKDFIIITGSNFLNKGSQSMLFSTVQMLKEKYPDKKIIMLSTKDYFDSKLDKGNFTFEILPDYLSRFIAPPIRYARKIFMKLTGEEGVMEKKEEMQKLEEILSHTWMLVDISGFALSSEWKSQVVSINYILRIAAAKYWKIPMYILPQSFGPFEYKFPYNLINNILNYYYLRYPRIICSREQDGVNCLQKYHLKNVKRVNDTVITTKHIELSKIYMKAQHLKKYEIKGEHPIAVIPNMRSIQRGKTEQLLELYEELINDLSKIHDIYLIRHSVEDIEGCRMIAERCNGNSRLHLIGDDMNCFEFEALVKQFDFCIAARFHSIVHAYKNGIPCISMGWAVKYKELLESFGQEKFLFDVRGGVDRKRLKNCIQYLESNYEVESNAILEKLPLLRQNNALSAMEENK